MCDTASAESEMPSKAKATHNPGIPCPTSATIPAVAMANAPPTSTSLWPTLSATRPHRTLVAAWLPTRIAVNVPTWWST